MRNGMRNGMRTSMRRTAAERLFKLCATLLLSGVAACVLLSLAWAGLHGAAPFDHTFITLDGEPLASSRWLGDHGPAAFGVLLLGAALLLVVPMIVVLPLLIVVAVLVAVLVLLAVLAGVLTLVCSPVVLLAAVIWLMWRLAHRRTEPAAEVSS